MSAITDGESLRYSSFQDIADSIKTATTRAEATLLIGIDGAGGSGKSTLAGRLAETIATSTIVHIDDFADWKEAPGWNIDRFITQFVNPLANGMTANYQRYDWPSDSLAEWHEISPGGVVIVEGVTPLRPELREFWHVSIWVECPRNLRLKRGIERDGESMRSQWEDIWMPEEDVYMRQIHPWEHATFIFDGSGSSDDLRFTPPFGDREGHSG